MGKYYWYNNETPKFDFWRTSTTNDVRTCCAIHVWRDNKDADSWFTNYRLIDSRRNKTAACHIYRATERSLVDSGLYAWRYGAIISIHRMRNNDASWPCCCLAKSSKRPETTLQGKSNSEASRVNKLFPFYSCRNINNTAYGNHKMLLPRRALWRAKEY